MTRIHSEVWRKFLAMGWKENVKDYLQFSRKERIAVTTIILLIITIFFLPRLVVRPAAGIQEGANADTAWIAAMKRLQRVFPPAGEEADDPVSRQPYHRSERSAYRSFRGELFQFDPNTLSETGWKKLGLREKTITTILNYLAKGGKFHQPGDLRRIYGLFPDEYERLAPYVSIAERSDPAVRKDPVTITDRPSLPKKDRVTVIDINKADTGIFISLPGIGSKLATRIVSFREKLGGFYSIEQVGETFGLADSTFQKIKPWLRLEKTVVRRININTASLEELKAHPYIRYQLANPIIAYRKEHGPFTKLEDLKGVMAITEIIYQRISPYLVTQ